MSYKNLSGRLACLISVFAMASLLATSSAFAQKATVTPLLTESKEVDLVTTVVSVDLASRIVVFQNDDGKQTHVKVGDAVQRLDEVKPGDRVKVRYYESVIMNLRRHSKDKPAATTELISERAPAGQLPAGLIARQITVTAEVTAIDLKKNKLTLKGPGGSQTVAVKKPENQAALKTLKEGDLIDVTYSEAMAAEVTKP